MKRTGTALQSGHESSISRQIILLLLTFAIFPMAVLTGLICVIDTSTHRQGIVQVQNEVADRVAQVVLSHIHSSLNSLRLLSLSSELVEQDRTQVRRILSNFLSHQSEFDTLALTQLDGLSATRLSRLHTFLEDEQEWVGEEPGFKRALHGQAGLGSVRISPFSRFPQLRLYMPITGKLDRVVGVICADMNISRMWRLVAGSFIGQDFSAYIVDGEGVLIAADDLSMVLERRDLKGLDAVKHFLAGEHGVFEYVGIGGARVVGVVVETPLTGWGVVVETPVETVYGHLKMFWWILGIASLGMILFAGFLGWLFSVRYILRPIRALQQDVQIIATGDLAHEITLKRTDELGRLASDLSSMIENLRDATVSRKMLVEENRERRKSEEALREKERRLSDILNFLPDATLAIDNERRIIIWNKAIEEMTGVPAEEMIGQGDYAYTVPFYGERRRQLMDLIWEPSEEVAFNYPHIRQEGHSFVTEVFCPVLYGGRGAWVFAKASPLHDQQGNVIGAIESIRDITDLKRAEEALEKRLVALTSPLDMTEGIEFEDLFNLEEIQKLQDQFARATGVASIITNTDGTPITSPSNFCRLCDAIIRHTEKGLKNCYYSDSVIGRHNPEGPIIQPCLSGGLWDAGASITVGGRHIANWLIGQVRNEAQDEVEMLEYAREIGADEKAFMEAFSSVPSMPEAQFEKIAQVLFTLAGQLSSMAYQNIQQARFITERKRSAEEKEKLQAQFLQAQKMESVGRLAGGIAHDFNNMLQAILGYTEMALGKESPADPVHGYLLGIRKAALRSAELVHQLLAFARKQVVTPRVLDLNDAIPGVIKILQRLIGEDVEVVWRPGRALWPIKIDPSQIHQLLVNLAVNARDAIAGVGTITIETDNAVFHEAYRTDNDEFIPGEYVCLAVSDDGCGMDSETREHIFEPFFTTKGLGKGTGLGLATVYGIIKQNNGFINVYSETGVGTTVKIYLPRFDEAEGAAAQAESETEALVGGTETVLVVEDETTILKICKTMLEELGYTVLTAESPGRAIRLVREFTGRIHLLITDVVMPEMNGQELAKEITSLHPGIRCLYMSGYTADVIAHRGVLDEGVHFIPKPFSVLALAQKVREAMED